MKIINSFININNSFFNNNVSFNNNIKKDSNILNKNLIKTNISKKGNILYNYARDENNPKITDNVFKLLKDISKDPSSAYKEYIDEIIYNKAINLKKGISEINKMDISDEKKEEKINILNNQYNRSISNGAKEISFQLDNYFDGSNLLLNIYSKEPVSEIFDRGKFESHMKYLSLSVKKSVFISDLEISNLKNKYENKTTNENSLEKMSIRDMKEVISYIYNEDQFSKDNNDSNESTGSKIANIENQKISFINNLDISESTKKGMIKAEKRYSEAHLRHFSYQQFMEKNDEKLDYFNDQINGFKKRLKKIEERLEALGITVDNKIIFSLLKQEKMINKKIQTIEKFKEEVLKEVNSLKKDKSKIVDKDIYKKNKKDYNKELDSGK